jgi:tRNA threonylcarbamoyladenosine biosynthesis protein TsaE
VTSSPGTAIAIAVGSPAEMRQLGERLSRLLRAGDLVVLVGSLGAGKTTLAQGIGAGLDVRGNVTSPTFVIARVHPPIHDGPSLVHVDAYRLGGDLEVDDLDLDASVEESVTLVEWGEGLVERLTNDRLVVRIERAAGDDTGDPGDDGGDGGVDERVVRLDGVGARWAGADLAALATVQTPATHPAPAAGSDD